MSKTKIISLVIALMGAGQAVHAAEASSIANRCTSCHGARGISTNPVYPNLAGQNAPYLLKQLQDFQSGKRTDPVMAAMARGLSKAEMESIAKYFSKMK